MNIRSHPYREQQYNCLLFRVVSLPDASQTWVQIRSSWLEFSERCNSEQLSNTIASVVSKPEVHVVHKAFPISVGAVHTAIPELSRSLRSFNPVAMWFRLRITHLWMLKGTVPRDFYLQSFCLLLVPTDMLRNNFNVFIIFESLLDYLGASSMSTS